MFKLISSAIYKTPWWAIALAGLFVFLLLVLLAVPFNVIRLADSGATRAENQAIQREIDHTFGDSALAVAERVVRVMVARTSDPARKSEFEQALKEITDAREQKFSAARTAERTISDAKRDAAREAKNVNREALAAARDVARGVRDDARERIVELQAARKETLEVQQRVGLQDDTAVAGIDKAINEATERQRTAEEVLKKLGTFPNNPISIMPPIEKFDTQIGPPQAPTSPTPPGAPESLKDGINFDVGTKDKRVRGSIRIGDDDRPIIQIDASDSVNIEPPPAPPLPPQVRDDIRRKVTSDFRRVGIGSALIVAFIPLFFILLIAKFYIGRSRRAQEVANLKTEEAESANVNRQMVEAKLMVLQAQVEPHFLYNTLANVQALTEVDPQQANQMTGHLISYLRASLPKMRENISTVGQELELVRAYLNILKMRMGSRLDFGIDVPEALLTLPFPPLMLPSLVENAIKHGLEPLREGGRIDVVGECVGVGDDATIRLMVKDTGRGLSDAPMQAGDGVGLANIRERLLVLFGDRARLTIEANTPKGVIATIAAPACGASAFPVAAKTAGPEVPKTWRAKTLHIAARTHSFWANLLVKVFLGIVALLGVVFIVGMIALATGSLPLNLGGTTITGIEGMALGTLGLLLAFGLLSIIALIVVAVIYGLGFLFLVLAISIPLMMMIAAFPALLPFAIVGFLFYWFWWRKRKSVVTVKPPGARE